MLKRKKLLITGECLLLGKQGSARSGMGSKKYWLVYAFNTEKLSPV
jgi:hypothetical protein